MGGEAKKEESGEEGENGGRKGEWGRKVRVAGEEKKR